MRYLEGMEKCLNCGTPLYGRPDKKYCSDKCKNSYHYGMVAEREKFQRKILAQIHRNYEILDAVLSAGKDSIERDFAEEKGFRCTCITGIHKKRNRSDEYSLFDIRYKISPDSIYGIRRPEAGY